MRIFFSTLIYTISLTACYTQNSRVEEKLMDCWYNSTITNKKSEFRNSFRKYQDLLVKEGFLKDGTGNSYKVFFEAIGKGKSKKRPSQSFISSIDFVVQLNHEKYAECKTKAIADTINYDSSKIRNFENVIDSVQEIDNYTRADIANGILSVLDEDDFGLEYYKVRAFLIYDFIILSDFWNYSTLKSINNSEIGHLENALNLRLDTSGDIFVNGNKTNLEEFKIKVRNYAESKKSESIFLFTTDDDMLYGNYIKFQDMVVAEIQFLREAYATRKYNSEFAKLSEERVREISVMYPIKLLEDTRN